MSDQPRPSDNKLEDGIIYTQKKALLNQLQQLEADLPKVNTLLPWYRQAVWQRVSWAAAIAGIAMLVWYLFDLSPDSGLHSKIAEHFELIPHPRETTKRGGELDREEQAVIAYQKGDFDEARERFAALVSEDQDSLALLFLGITQLRLGDADEAIASIRQFLAYDSDTFGEAPYYYLALAHIQLGELRLARTYASQIDDAQYKERVEAALGENVGLDQLRLTTGGIIEYYFNRLTPVGTSSGPVSRLKLDTSSYYYFPGDDTAIKNEDYWHHVANMPLPNSFSFVYYTYDKANHKLVVHSNADIGPAYGNNTKFLANIREEGFKRLFYNLEEQALNETFLLAELGHTTRFDYKTIDTLVTPFSEDACGAKCREALFTNYKGSPELIILYSEENRDTTDKRYYYIPCLGKVDCNTTGPADIVYYNADSTELVDNWLKPFNIAAQPAQPPYELYGVADNIGKYQRESFGQGTDTVSIMVTKNSSELKLKYDCVPVRSRCN